MAQHRRSVLKGSGAYLKRAPSKLLGQIRNSIGADREKAAYEALQPNEECPLPGWIHSVALGLPEEDRRGIDLVIHTDIGKIFLQIKGSRLQVERFLTKHRKGNIVPFIVNQTSDLGPLRTRLVECLQRERTRILKLRSHA